MKKFKKLMIVGMIALAALIGFQSNSNALTLGFYDGVGPYYIHDNITTNLLGNELPDQNPLLGAVTYIGTLGDWSVQVTTGVSTPIIGSAGDPQLILSSVNISTASPTPEIIYVALVDSYFTGPISGSQAGPFTLAVGGTTAGSVSVLAFSNASNSEPFNGTPFTSLVFSSNNGPAFSGSGTGLGVTPTNGSFSLGIQAVVTHTGEGSTTFGASLRAVPEPSVILLMGVGLIGIWGFRKKFKK